VSGAGTGDPRRIFAMGGGGFAMEPGNPALDRYVLELGRARRPDPRICLLPTAGGDSEEQVHRFLVAFSDEACEPTHFSLFRRGRRPLSLEHHLLEQDIVYVGGGSMLNLMVLWRAHGVDRLLREAWRRGIVLCGLSAGSMCWFERGITTSTGRPTPAPGLGLLRGSNSVHYDGEPERRPVYLAAVADGSVPGGYGVDDGAGLLFEGTRLAEVVSSRAAARAYRVAPAGAGRVAETALPTRVLEAFPAGETPPEVAELRRLRAGGPRGAPHRRSARLAG
jgi:peptidase E